MISHSLETMDLSEWVTSLTLVIRPEDRAAGRAGGGPLGNRHPVPAGARGGRSRHRSEARGLESLAGAIGSGSIDLVAIHDGARPFLSLTLLDRLFRHAHRYGGAIPTRPMEAPAYRVAANRDLARAGHGRLHRAQTPQVFSAPELLSAYRRAGEAGFEGVDTAETVERFSDLRIGAVPGDPGNLKLTFPEDFESIRLPGEEQPLPG